MNFSRWLAIPSIGLSVRDSRDDILWKESLQDHRSKILRGEGLKKRQPVTGFQA